MKNNLHTPNSLKIFLLGFMGAGKTTIGKKLAKALEIPFLDLDQVIEKEEGATITTLFAKLGEAEFRKLEGSYLKSFSYPEQFLLATGGGTPCFYDHLDWMNDQGTTIYLKLSSKSLHDRLKNATKEDRPLLQNKNESELLTYIETSLSQREPFYSKAQITLKGENLSIKDFVNIFEHKI